MHNTVINYNTSGVGGFDGSRGVQAISGCLAATPTPVRKNSHRIFTFRVDPTGQLRGEGSGPLDPPASYAAV